MGSESSELVLKVTPDLGGLRRIQALIAELSAVANRAAASSKGTVAQATAEMERLRKAQQGAAASQAKLNSEIKAMGLTAGTAFKKGTAAVDKHTRSTVAGTKANQAYKGSIRGISGALGGLWFSYTSIIPTIAAFGAAMSLRKAIAEGAEFTFQLRAIQGISQTTGAAIDKAGDAVLRLGESSLQGPLELVKGFRILTQAGFTAAQAMTALPSVSALAVIGQMDLSAATVIASGAMHQFTLEASDLGHVTDVLGKSAAVSATTVAQIGQAMSYTAGIASTLDVSLEEVSAALSTIALRGITGSKAGTSFQRAMLNLAAGTPKTKAALKELNVEVFDLEGNFKGIQPVFADLKKALAGFNKEARASFLRDIFGVRAMKAASALIDGATTSLVEFTDAAKKSSEGIGFANEQLVLMSQTAKGQATLAFNTFTASLVKGARDAESAMFDVANSAREVFKSKEFSENVTLAIKGLASFTQALIDHRGALLALGKAYLWFQAIGIVKGILGGKALLGTVRGVRKLSQAFMNVGTAVAFAGRGVTTFSVAATVLEGEILAPLLAGLAAIGPQLFILVGALAAAGTAWIVFRDKTAEAAKVKIPNFEPMLEQMRELADTRLQAALSKYKELFNIDTSAQAKARLKDAFDLLRIKRDIAETELAGLGGPRHGVFNVNRTTDQVRAQAAADAKRAALISRIAQLSEAITNNEREQAKIATALVQAGVLEANNKAKIAANAKKTAGLKARAEAPGKEIKATLAAGRAEIAQTQKIFKERRRLLAQRRVLINDEGEFKKRSLAISQSEKEALLTIEAEYAGKFRAIKTRSKEDEQAIADAAAELGKASTEADREAQIAATKAFYARLNKVITQARRSAEASDKATASATSSLRVLDATSGGRDYLTPLVTLNEAKLKIEQDYNAKVRKLRKDRLLADNLNGEDRLLALAELDDAMLKADDAKQAKLILNARRASDARKDIAKAEAKVVISSMSSTLGSIADLIGDSDKKTFERSKKFRLAQATMDTAASVVSTVADTKGPWPVKVIAGIAAAAAGLVQIQNIRRSEYSGQAHDGLESVPNTGTYILEKGERVVKKEDNKKLQRFLDDGSSSQNPVQVNLSITAMDGKSVAQVLSQNEGLIQRLVQNGYNQRLVTGGPLR